MMVGTLVLVAVVVVLVSAISRLHMVVAVFVRAIGQHLVVGVIFGGIVGVVIRVCLCTAFLHPPAL